MSNLKKEVELVEDLAGILKDENDKAEAKWRERVWAEAWQKGLDEEYRMQIEFERLIQHN